MSKVDRMMIRLLRPIGRRLRLRNGLYLAARTLWLPVLLTVLVLLAGRLILLPHHQRLAWVPMGLWLLVVLGYSLLYPLPPLCIARRVDSELALCDRLTTALELGRRVSAGDSRFDRALVTHQRNDALAVARSIEPARAFPIRWPRRPLALAVGCLIVALLLNAIPNPMDAILAERTTVAKVVREQADQLEELAEELAQVEALDPADQEELLRQLREATEQLRANSGDRERGLADLAQLEESLRQQLDPQNAARQAALGGLATDLSAVSGMSDQTPSLDEAARLLEELAKQAAEMSSAEREGVASVLDDAARRLAGSDADLAGALSQLAQGLRESGSNPSQSDNSSSNNDPATSAEMQTSARAAANALRTANAETALQQTLAQTLNQTQQSNTALAQAGQQQLAQADGQGEQSQAQGQQPGQGQSQSQQSGQGQGQQLGQGQGQSQQSDQGQGLGQQQGQGSSQQSGQSQGQGQQQGQGQDRRDNSGQGPGGGQGRGQSGDDSPTNSAGVQGARPSSTGQVDVDDPVGVGELDTVFVPWQQGQPGDDDFVPGRQTDQGQVAARENAQLQPGVSGAAQVPYTEVFASYAASAAETMERAYIPAGLRDYVREYFTHLEP